MKRRFLIHSLNHTVLVVDISSVGLPTASFPAEGWDQMLPSLRFQSWQAADAYFHRLGADPKAIESAKKSDVAVLTIV